MTLDTNIANVHQRIAIAARDVNRRLEDIQLLAVSKTRHAETLRQAYALGLRQFGENYVQEALEKQSALTDLAIEWHFIGPIQSNKTRDIARHFTWVHSVDRVKIAKRLHDAATRPLNICLQVNISEEASKSGILPNALPALIKDIAQFDRLNIRGLMAIPAATHDSTKQRAAFHKMQTLLIELQQDYPHMDTLSMGMSGDLESAIAEGATIVRIGTDLFGPRVTPV